MKIPLLKFRNTTKNISLRAAKYTIQQSTKIKVLRIYITSGLSNVATANNIISKFNLRLNTQKSIFKYASYRTKKIVTTSIIYIYVFRYSAPIIIDSNIFFFVLYIYVSCLSRERAFNLDFLPSVIFIQILDGVSSLWLSLQFYVNYLILEK